MNGGGWLLAAAVRLLPAPRREWGAAMLAELDGIGPAGERRRFAAGCVAAILTRPAVWRRVGYALLPVAAAGFVVRWSAAIDWAPRRWGVVAFALLLAAVAELGVFGPLGPVGAGWAARATRLVAYALVGVLAVEAGWFMAHQTNADLGGEPVLAVVFAGFLAGALAVTGHRAAVTARTLLTGLAGGFGLAGVWAALVLLDPPVPADVGLAVVLLGTGLAGIGSAVERRRGPAAAWTAAATAGTIAVLLIFNIVTVLSATGADDLIPHLLPPLVPARAQVAGSRIELPDHYLWLLLLGWFLALAQWAAARPAREPDAGAAAVPPGGSLRLGSAGRVAGRSRPGRPRGP
ncbi:hypothetical protein Dvina_25670 [Dactylosporangium vinaceum]|uniref:Integral membrane protein n=1 Tax=Dactylosporangium vinaceum TaxID=53362 RepID=A0ABV5MDJ5_9ACTN|nr:hypothetical protein [Dactylosporangium vinaceum]UAC02491.1 hypothetical protein Dvina_25670 [Dactylosporangium vinaceum]